MAIRYAVDLTDTCERAALREIISKNKAKRSTIINAYILLKADRICGWTGKTLLQHMKCPQKKSSSSRNVLSKKVLTLRYIANR